MIHTKQFTFGLFQVHNYLFWDDVTRQAIVFDAGKQPDQLVAFIKQERLVLSHLLLTHAHIDHVEGWETLQTEWPDLQIWGHKEAAFWLDQLKAQATIFGMTAPERPVLTRELAHGEQLALLAGLPVEVRHAPGHAPESLCYWMPTQNACVVGDVIFYRSIGRTDFPRGDHQTLLDSIDSQIFTLPPDATLYPGHGRITTVAQEQQANPFVGHTHQS